MIKNKTLCIRFSDSKILPKLYFKSCYQERFYCQQKTTIYL